MVSGWKKYYRAFDEGECVLIRSFWKISHVYSRCHPISDFGRHLSLAGAVEVPQFHLVSAEKKLQAQIASFVKRVHHESCG